MLVNSFNVLDDSRDVALKLVVSSGNVLEAYCVLDSLMDPNCLVCGPSALWRAACETEWKDPQPRYHMVSTLLSQKAGANIGSESMNIKSLLQVIRTGIERPMPDQEGIGMALCEHRACVYAKDSNGWNALHCSANFRSSV